MCALELSSADAEKRAVYFGRAWAALAASLTLHVIDEALTGFLEVYNPAVLSLRGRWPWLPLPTFTFWPWLTGLAAGIGVVWLLYPRARRGVPWVAATAIPLSVVMIGNALGHLGASVYFHRLMPGMYSSPVLLVAAVLTLFTAVRLRMRFQRPAPPIRSGR